MYRYRANASIAVRARGFARGRHRRLTRCNAFLARELPPPILRDSGQSARDDTRTLRAADPGATQASTAGKSELSAPRAVLRHEQAWTIGLCRKVNGMTDNTATETTGILTIC
jgi:hypothetical protein